jgi:hypothetical protein
MLELADRLPPRLDASAVAGRLAAGGARVQVVVATTPEDALTTVAGALGVRPAAAQSAVVGPVVDPVVDPVVVDVRRRLNLVRGRAAPDPLDDWCAPADGPPLGAPPARIGWLRTRSAELARRLRTADYPVHGEPGDVTALLDGDVRRGVAPQAALEATVRALGTGWQRLHGHGPS